MALSAVQTDTSLTFETGCATESSGVTNAARELVIDGTAGATAFTIDPDNNSTSVCLVFRTSGGVGTTDWASGTHDFNITISGSNGTNTLTKIYICERTSGGTYNTVQEFTGLGLDLSGGGVQSTSLVQSADYTPAGTDSDIAYVCVIQNADMHGNSTTDIVPDQTITFPYTLTSPQTLNGTVVSDPWNATTGFLSLGIVDSVTDSFTDTDNTRLEDHIADDGETGWILGPNSGSGDPFVEIVNNEASHGPDGFAKYFLNRDLSSNDYFVEVDINFQSTNGFAGVRARMQTDVDAGYRWTPDNNGVWSLNRLDAEGGELLDSWDSGGNPGAGNTQTARLEVEGDQIRAYVEGTLQASATDSTYSTGRPGFRMNSDGSDDNPHLDNFSAGILSGPQTLAGVSIEDLWEGTTGSITGVATLDGVAVSDPWNATTGSIISVVTLHGVTINDSWNATTGSLSAGQASLQGVIIDNPWNATIGALSPGVVVLDGVVIQDLWNATAGTVLPGPAFLSGVIISDSWDTVIGSIEPGAVSLQGTIIQDLWNATTGDVTAAGGPQTLNGVVVVDLWNANTGNISSVAILSGSIITDPWVATTGSIGSVATLQGTTISDLWNTTIGALQSVATLQGTTIQDLWNTATGTLSPGPATLSGTVVDDQWVATIGALSGADAPQTLQGSVIVSIWNVSTGAIQPGVAILTGQIVEDAWDSTTGLVQPGVATLSGQTIEGLWNVQTGQIDPGTAFLQGDVISDLWNVHTGQLSALTILQGLVISDPWVAETGSIQGGAATLQGVPIVALWGVSTGNITAVGLIDFDSIIQQHTVDQEPYAAKAKTRLTLYKAKDGHAYIAIANETEV